VNPYADPNTRVNFNRLGIADGRVLQIAEYQATAIRIQELELAPIAGEFDLEHWRAIHKHLFQDIYDWAGKERTLNLSKVDPVETWWKSRFAPHDRIHELVEQMAREIKALNRLQGLSPADFVAGITKVYVMANHTHPFPEGNGRSTQTLLSQLAREAGYELRFSNIDKRSWDMAAARSMPQVNAREHLLTRPADAQLIHAAFKTIVVPLERVRQADPER
jgi:cell filamentation protein